MKNLKTQFEHADLPEIQKKFISQFDGTVKSIVNFHEINIILNPTFSYHYFYVSGDTMENTITTKHTTGESAPWGDQSKEAENNSYLLRDALKQFLLNQKLYIQNGGDFQPYNPKEVRKNKLFVKINGEMKRISGLTALNIK